MVIAYIARCSLRVFDLVDSEKPIVVAIVGDVEFCHPHTRANSLRAAFNTRSWNWSNCAFYTGRRNQFLDQRESGFSRNFRLSILRAVPRRTHVAKC